MRPEVGVRDLSSAPEPKSLQHLHRRGREDQAAPEPEALIALKHAGLQGQAGMVKALMPLWWAHHEVLAFWGMPSPPLTWRPGLCQPQFFLPDGGEAVPAAAVATNARGDVLEGAQPMMHLGETLHLTRAATATFLRDETRVVSVATATHGLTWNLLKQLPEAPSKSHPTQFGGIPPNPVWWLCCVGQASWSCV